MNFDNGVEFWFELDAKNMDVDEKKSDENTELDALPE